MVRDVGVTAATTIILDTSQGDIGDEDDDGDDNDDDGTRKWRL